jgi:hypothetical protein
MYGFVCVCVCVESALGTNNLSFICNMHFVNTVIPRLTKIIRSGITFVSRNVISRRFL